MTRREWMLTMAAAAVRTHDVVQAQPNAIASEDVTALSLTELVARIVRRELSPLSATDAYLARIEAMNRGLNAFITVTPERARVDAWRASRTLPPPPATLDGFPIPLLLGAPIAHKDLLETAGVRTTAGSRLYESHVPARDAFIVSQLSRAGAVMLGKTNTHELGGGVTTINPFFGTTRNPIDRLRIAGGSSGGSAAAVVARLCAAATGSDTGGSVRIPAALCGCVGFKPSFGRISTAGLLGSCPTFDHVGFLTRTVADAERMFAAAVGNPKGLPPQDSGRTVPRQGASSGLPSPPFKEGASGPLKEGSGGNPLGLPIKVGIPRPFFFDRLQPDVARAIELAIQRFRAMGATVEDVDFPITSDTMARVFDPIVVAEIWAHLGPRWRRQPEAFSPGFASFFKAPVPSDLAVRASHQALRDFQRAVDRLFDRVQIVLTPTVPVTAPLIEGPIDGLLILRNTWPFNAAGTPAISVPCGVDAGGLPIGLQLIARRQQDQLLLHAARTIESTLRG